MTVHATKGKDTDRPNLTIGKWYLQYSAGYWQLLDLKPKYAMEDYSDGFVSWEKGDRLGDWAIVKKGFTAKMKHGIRIECVDSVWLKPVSSETEAEILLAFAEDPKYEAKFRDAGNMPVLHIISNVWLTLTDREESELTAAISSLPEVFCMEDLLSKAALPPACFGKPPCTHLMNLQGFPWESDEDSNRLFRAAELTRIGETHKEY